MAYIRVVFNALNYGKVHYFSQNKYKIEKLSIAICLVLKYQNGSKVIKINFAEKELKSEKVNI
jgi:hypothetical protein